MLWVILIVNILLIIGLAYYLTAVIMIPKEEVNYDVNKWFAENALEAYPCLLFLSFSADPKDIMTSVYDFSLYEDYRIIGLTTSHHMGKEYYDEEGKPKVAVLPNQIVYYCKDGSYQWDFRAIDGGIGYEVL